MDSVCLFKHRSHFKYRLPQLLVWVHPVSQMVFMHTTDSQQKGFFGRAIKKLEALLGRTSSGALALAHGLDTRLNASQKQAIHLNRALMYLLAGKLGACKEVSAGLATAYPSSPLVVMLQAVLLAREGKVRR